MENQSQRTISTGTIVKAFLVLLLFMAIYIARDIILIIITSIVLAAAIEPMANWFVKRRVPRILSVVGIYTLLGGIIFSAFYFIFIPILGEATALLSTVPTHIQEVSIYTPLSESGILEKGESLVLQIPQKEALSINDIAQQVNAISGGLAGNAFISVSSIFGGVLSFIIIIVLSFYFAVQHDGIEEFLRTITPPKYKDYTLDLWKRSEKKIGLWMQGQFLLIILIGVLTYLGLFVLGVKYALLLGVLAGLFELIPIFGPVLAAIPAILISYSIDGFTLALIVAGLYVAIQQFESQVIYPLVVRKVVGVPALIVIIALILGFQLGGFLGLLISVPIAAIVMEAYKDLQKKQLEQERQAV